MYAQPLTVKESIPVVPESPIPYCFILDDTYRVVMAGPSGGEDPLAPLYAADSRIDELPGPIDRVVRALTATWRTSRAPSNVSAIVSNLQVTAAPLHGYDGRRIAVFIRRHEQATR
ncbi:MAG TPA: hypothetical protein VMD47_11575 [Candidatus Acidoferrales bacterium]|nr:hypothetical protein [Candidatus Acidoferrales bacterium]